MVRNLRGETYLFASLFGTPSLSGGQKEGNTGVYSEIRGSLSADIGVS